MAGIFDKPKRASKRFQIVPCTLMFSVPHNQKGLSAIGVMNGKQFIKVGDITFDVQPQYIANDRIKCYHAFKTFTDARELKAAQDQILAQYGVQSYTSE